METNFEQILATARRFAAFRARDVIGAPDPRTHLRRMVARSSYVWDAGFMRSPRPMPACIMAWPKPPSVIRAG